MSLDNTKFTDQIIALGGKFEKLEGPNQEKNLPRLLNVKADFKLFYDRPIRDETGQLMEIGTNYCKARHRDIFMKVEEGLQVSELGQLVVERTLRLQPASHYAVDSANILNHQPHESRLEQINLENALVVDGTHYNLVLYRI